MTAVRPVKQVSTKSAFSVLAPRARAVVFPKIPTTEFYVGKVVSVNDGKLVIIVGDVFEKIVILFWGGLI
jgi:hypothetical protein